MSIQLINTDTDQYKCYTITYQCFCIVFSFLFGHSVCSVCYGRFLSTESHLNGLWMPEWRKWNASTYLQMAILAYSVLQHSQKLTTTDLCMIVSVLRSLRHILKSALLFRHKPQNTPLPPYPVSRDLLLHTSWWYEIFLSLCTICFGHGISLIFVYLLVLSQFHRDFFWLL